jgi:hypothetical protein
MFGESYGIGPFVPHLDTLPLPPVPTPDYLRLRGDWSAENARRLELAAKFLGENDELETLLYENILRVEFNRYNLEVYLSISKLCRQNLLLLKELEAITRNLQTAQDQAAKLHYVDALDALDQALDTADVIRDERNQVLHDATMTWYDTWFPRVREANGRRAARAPQDFVETEPQRKNPPRSGRPALPARPRAFFALQPVVRGRFGGQKSLRRGAQLAGARRTIRVAGFRDSAQPNGRP